MRSQSPAGPGLALLGPEMGRRQKMDLNHRGRVPYCASISEDFTDQPTRRGVDPRASVQILQLAV